MTTMNNEDPADLGTHEPRVTDSPVEIWLQYGDIERDCTHAELYRAGDVTWCKDKCFASDVRYVRADLLHGPHEPKPSPPADVALPEPAAWVRNWLAPHQDCVTRAQSEDETYGMLECVADRAGDSSRRGKRTCADGAGSVDVDAVEHAARARGMEMMGPGKDVRATSAGLPAGYTPQDIVDLLLLTAGGNECSYAAQGAGEIERLREVVKACHQALFQAQEAAKMLFAKGEMLAAVVQGAREEFVRVPYGASHEDVAAINDWHKMAAEALAAWESTT